MSAPLMDRPVPLRDAFKSVGSTVALAGSVLTALVGYGVVSSTQADATTALLGAIPGVVSLVTSLLSAYGVVHKAEPQVTPVSDPVAVQTDDAGFVKVVPLTPPGQ